MKKVNLLSASIAILCLSTMSCKKDDDPKPSTPTPVTPTPITKVGESFQGGITFYVSPDGKHGLIVAPIDQSAGVKWCEGPGNYFVFSNPGQYSTTSFVNGLGQYNTTYLVNYFGAGDYAAYLCDTLTLNGYNDWFLPSIDQIENAYQSLPNNTFVKYTNYFSSSEGSSDGAYVKTIGAGIGVGNNKLTLLHVRAVRAF